MGLKKLIMKFWEFDAKMDVARLSKQTFPSGLTEVLDIPYAKTEHKLQRLDVYYPADIKKNAKLPVIVDIHGGGWFYGDKELNKNYCLHLAKKGFVVFNLSYRLVPEVTMDNQIQDCMQALDFIGKHLKDYPCNKNRIYLVGDSAGGQLASLAAALNVSEKLRKAFKTANPGLNIKAVSLISPVSDLTPKGYMRPYLKYVLGKNYKKTSWGKYVKFEKVAKEAKKKYPPAIIYTSFMDIVANSQSKNACKVLKKCGVDVKLDYKYNPKLNHVYQVLEPDLKQSEAAIDKMIKFFNKHK